MQIFGTSLDKPPRPFLIFLKGNVLDLFPSISLMNLCSAYDIPLKVFSYHDICLLNLRSLFHEQKREKGTAARPPSWIDQKQFRNFHPKHKLTSLCFWSKGRNAVVRITFAMNLEYDAFYNFLLYCVLQIITFRLLAYTYWFLFHLVYFEEYNIFGSRINIYVKMMYRNSNRTEWLTKNGFIPALS